MKPQVGVMGKTKAGCGLGTQPQGVLLSLCLLLLFCLFVCCLLFILSADLSRMPVQEGVP